MASEGLKVSVDIEANRLIVYSHSNHVVRYDGANQSFRRVGNASDCAGSSYEQVAVLRPQDFDCVKLFFEARLVSISFAFSDFSWSTAVGGKYLPPVVGFGSRFNHDIFGFDSWPIENRNALRDLPDGRNSPSVLTINRLNISDGFV